MSLSALVSLRWFLALIGQPSFPPAVLCSQCPFRFSLPSTRSPRGGFPGFTSTVEHSDFSPPFPATSVALASRYSRRGYLFAPTGCPHSRSGTLSAWPGSPLRPRGNAQERWRDLPGSWAALVHVPCSQTPAGPRARPHGPSVLPSASLTTSAPASDLTRLNHTAHAPPVYASVRQSPDAPQHSVPGGGQPSRARFALAGLLKGLRCIYVIFPPSRLGPAHQRQSAARQGAGFRIQHASSPRRRLAAFVATASGFLKRI
jgi:hypothetical protein